MSLVCNTYTEESKLKAHIYTDNTEVYTNNTLNLRSL